jgi:hypothetical protein
MSANLVQCAVAANSDVPACVPGPFQDCRDEIHISLFFDGTGNNREADGHQRKWSNVARLFDSAFRSAQLNKLGKVHAIYISGVGTEFNGSAANWLDGASVWMEDKLGGAGAGYGGDRRMQLGTDLVNDYLRSALISNSQRLGGAVAKYAAKNSNKSFSDVNLILAKYRLIKSINLYIYGFSRGAALARAFANRIVANCNRSGKVLYYGGYPLRINFMGLFDTVASFGIPSVNARTPFTERELIVPSAVERCVHFVAAHELRFSFPVDLIRKDGKLAGNWSEKVFPGVHSDVGGGYAPMEQGVYDNYARIPLREMLSEALLAGARIIDYENLKRLYGQLFQERFECSANTETAYSRYMAACPGIGGTVEQQIKAHMKLYYSANGTMSRRRVDTVRDRSLKASNVKALLGPKGMAAEVAACRSSSNSIRAIRLGGTSTRSFAQYLRIQDWQLAAWDATADDSVVDFFSRYIHDSKVDFLLNVEPFSYFSARGVGESSINIWQEGGYWLGSKARLMTDTAAEAVEKAEDKAREIGNASSETAKKAAGAVQRTAEQAVEFASAKLNESAQATSRTYMTAVKAGGQMISVGEQAMGELERKVETIYESGINWARQKFD